MKVLVTGANGQLGYDVVKVLKEKKIECISASRTEIDITNEKQVLSFIKFHHPDVVIHCAAYTAVDKAEDEKELCYKVNVMGTEYVTKACREIDAKIVYISTDYVFNGEGEEPFKVTDIPDPINYYGTTKWLGEELVKKHLTQYFIVRISWVFGEHGNNFVKTMLKLGKERDEISVVCDQVGSPTYTVDVANLLAEMIQTDAYGIYHATNEGYCSWYEFACEIFRQAKMDVKVNPIRTEDYPTRAKRPKNSRLGKNQLTNKNFNKLVQWEIAIQNFIGI